ncbi:unnamed protein product [Discosporangium mesarthrocarpum]
MASYMEAVHYSGKEGFPSIAYKVTVDHTGCVLGVLVSWEPRTIKQISDSTN